MTDPELVEDAEVVDLVPIGERSIYVSQDPVEQLSEARARAKVLVEVVVEQGLSKSFGGGRPHVFVEGWQFLASQFGLIPDIEWTKELDDGWEARCALRRLSDGQVISHGDAECRRTESNWKNSDSYAIRSMAECVPLDAEILTAHGWRTHDNLRVGEIVLGYDLDADRCVWTRLTAVNVFAAGAKQLLRLTSRSFDVICTSDHSWATHPTNKQGLRRMVSASELRKGRRIVLSAPGPEGVLHLPREAAIWGWLITDGTFRQVSSKSWRAHIDQCEGDAAEKIRKLLRGWVTSETITHPDPERLAPGGKPWGRRPVVRWNIAAKALRGIMERTGVSDVADLPRFVALLDSVSRQAMLGAMIDADGWRRKPHGRWAFGKRKQSTIDVLHTLCALEGIPLGRQQRSKDGFPIWAERKDRVVGASALTFTEIASQPTWCPTTHAGTWVMRWRGQVTITGNTRAVSKVCRIALSSVMVMAGFAATPAEEMSGVTSGGTKEPPKSSDDPHCPACLAVNDELVPVQKFDKKPFWRCVYRGDECAGSREYQGTTYSWSGWHNSWEKSAQEWLDDNGHAGPRQVDVEGRGNHWGWVLKEIVGTLGVDKAEAKARAKTGLFTVIDNIDLAEALGDENYPNPADLTDEHLAAIAVWLTAGEAQLVVSAAVETP